MAVVKGRVEPIDMVQGSTSLGSVRAAAPGQVPVAAAVPVIFTVDKQVVSFDGRFQVIAAEGDEILVAGTIKEDGILHATAYENLTRAVGKNGVLPRAWTIAIYVGSAISALIYLLLMALIGADLGEYFLIGMGLVIVAMLLAPPLFTRAYNQRMKRDAQELATYARDHLLTRRD
jgi:hypothetical protein